MTKIGSRLFWVSPSAGVLVPLFSSLKLGYLGVNALLALSTAIAASGSAGLFLLRCLRPDLEAIGGTYLDYRPSVNFALVNKHYEFGDA
jgi:hypothetical protein